MERRWPGETPTKRLSVPAPQKLLSWPQAGCYRGLSGFPYAWPDRETWVLPRIWEYVMQNDYAAFQAALIISFAVLMFFSWRMFRRSG